MNFLNKRFGAKRLLVTSLLCWIGIVAYAAQITTSTQFRFYLPANDRVEPVQVESILPALTGNGELILIVDDEPSI